MSFRIMALPAEPFEHLYGKDDAALAVFGCRAYIADAKPGFPCRIGLRDAEPGERVLLVNHEHLAVDSPYRSSHAVYVVDGARPVEPVVGVVPPYLKRLLSVRAFGADHMMLEADVTDGDGAAMVFGKYLSNPGVAYLHVHSARRGCYLARVERA
ncbi:MAG: DUF1203 domain-containing protein [Alphaproteobacteria bacterium]|nr:MAG: DUF1203 domain-containing protein [Alphaproteobacteria bacterium]